MNLQWRKVSSIDAFNKTVNFLTNDVVRHGGSATEVIDVHNKLIQLTVSTMVDLKGDNVGTVVIKKEVSHLEALAWFLEGVE